MSRDDWKDLIVQEAVLNTMRLTTVLPQYEKNLNRAYGPLYRCRCRRSRRTKGGVQEKILHYRQWYINRPAPIVLEQMFQEDDNEQKLSKRYKNNPQI